MDIHDVIKTIPKELEVNEVPEEGYDCKGVKYIKRKIGKGKDITGKRNNKLIALFPVRLPDNNYRSEGVYWLCQCDCGNLIVVNGRALKPKSHESCGCIRKEEQIGKGLKDLTGQTFGRLTVIKRNLDLGVNEKGQRKKTYWVCKCECGTIKSIEGSGLKSGLVKSCGCFRKERHIEATSYDLIGKKYNKLLVLDKAIIDNKLKWKCLCDCGNITYTTTGALTSGHTKSCGCLQKEVAHDKFFIDLTGQVFGKLKVLELAEKKNGKIMWRCQCECGNIIETRGTDLRYRKFRSCGCIESRGEQTITNLLVKNNISFTTQKRFDTCRNPETNAQLIFDFYINDSFLLEYDGVQHYQTSTGWNNEEHLNYTQRHDNIKNQWCKENNIPLKRIPYWELKNITIENIMDDTFLIT